MHLWFMFAYSFDSAKIQIQDHMHVGKFSAPKGMPLALEKWFLSKNLWYLQELWFLPTIGSFFLPRERRGFPWTTASLPFLITYTVDHSDTLSDKAPGSPQILMSSFCHLSLESCLSECVCFCKVPTI